MWNLQFGRFGPLALLGARVQLPPTPLDFQAREFESVPGHAVLGGALVDSV